MGTVSTARRGCERTFVVLSQPLKSLTNLRFANESARPLANLTICGQRSGRECIFTFRTDPQFSMVVPLRSQARLWLSLLHWAYYGLFPPLAAASVRPSVSFADSIPQFSMVAPLRSRARLRYSLLHWGLRTGLRFAGPVFRGCGRPLGVSSPLHPFGASTATACFRHRRRPSHAPLALSLGFFTSWWPATGRFCVCPFLRHLVHRIFTFFTIARKRESVYNMQ